MCFVHLLMDKNPLYFEGIQHFLQIRWAANKIGNLLTFPPVLSCTVLPSSDNCSFCFTQAIPNLSAAFEDFPCNISPIASDMVGSGWTTGKEAGAGGLQVWRACSTQSSYRILAWHVLHWTSKSNTICFSALVVGSLFHLNLRLKVKKSGEHLQEEKSTRASDSVCV